MTSEKPDRIIYCWICGAAGALLDVESMIPPTAKAWIGECQRCIDEKYDNEAKDSVQSGDSE